MAWEQELSRHLRLQVKVPLCLQGRSQDFREGGAKYVRVKRARANFGHDHLRNGKVKVQIITENTVASKLESTFLTEFWDKVSLVVF